MLTLIKSQVKFQGSVWSFSRKVKILSQFFSTEQIYEMKNVNISSASMSGAQRPEQSLILILNSNMVWLMKTGRGQISHLIGELIKTCKSSLKI